MPAQESNQSSADHGQPALEGPTMAYTGKALCHMSIVFVCDQADDIIHRPLLRGLVNSDAISEIGSRHTHLGCCELTADNPQSMNAEP